MAVPAPPRRYCHEVASPLPQPADPASARPPAADPQAIRACLPPEVAAVFDTEWEGVLEAAKQSKDLAGVRDLLAQWRHHACQELQEPGSYLRVLAVAAQTEVTRRPPAGSLSAAEVRALVDARLAEARTAEAGHR